MRVRYFLTILAVLAIVASTSIALHAIFLKQERLELIDQQVRETAAALVDSELGSLKQINFDYADEIISEELGESRIGKFFVIRNQKDEIIFESASAKLLPIPSIPRAPQWVQITAKGKYVRILNLQLPRVPDRTLQVGLVLDEHIVNPEYLSKSTFIFIVTILVIGLAVSWLSTSFLLRPITDLEGFLSSLNEKSKYQTKLPGVPAGLNGGRVPPNDEFKRMVTVLDNLISRVNKNYELSRLWAYQMAHELKTPLSILKLQIEKSEKKYGIESTDIELITTEEQKISDTINSFLAWAELENSSMQQHLFVNKINDTLNALVQRLFKDSERPVLLRLNENFNVVSNPQHLEQLLLNLLSNANNYSPAGSPIEIESRGRSLTIRDMGKGLPEEVVTRLGEPFNKGNDNSGHGLGLAWVKSICRMYDWDLQISSSQDGTSFKIDFKYNEPSLDS